MRCGLAFPERALMGRCTPVSSATGARARVAPCAYFGAQPFFLLKEQCFLASPFLHFFFDLAFLQSFLTCFLESFLAFLAFLADSFFLLFFFFFFESSSARACPPRRRRGPSARA